MEPSARRVVLGTFTRLILSKVSDPVLSLPLRKAFFVFGPVDGIIGFLLRLPSFPERLSLFIKPLFMTVIEASSSSPSSLDLFRGFSHAHIVD